MIPSIHTEWLEGVMSDTAVLMWDPLRSIKPTFDYILDFANTSLTDANATVVSCILHTGQVMSNWLQVTGYVMFARVFFAYIYILFFLFIKLNLYQRLHC